MVPCPCSVASGLTCRACCGLQIGQFLHRKVGAAAAAARIAQESGRADTQDELEDEGEGVQLIQELAQPQIPPRMSVAPAAVARRPRQPKVVTISTGTEEVKLEIAGTERVEALDSNLKALLATHAALPHGTVSAIQLLSLQRPCASPRGQEPLLLRPGRQCCCGVC